MLHGFAADGRASESDTQYQTLKRTDKTALAWLSGGGRIFYFNRWLASSVNAPPFGLSCKNVWKLVVAAALM